jgi:hypothetical protein
MMIYNNSLLKNEMIESKNKINAFLLAELTLYIFPKKPKTVIN